MLHAFAATGRRSRRYGRNRAHYVGKSGHCMRGTFAAAHLRFLSPRSPKRTPLCVCLGCFGCSSFGCFSFNFGANHCYWQRQLTMNEKVAWLASKGAQEQTGAHTQLAGVSAAS